MISHDFLWFSYDAPMISTDFSGFVKCLSPISDLLTSFAPDNTATTLAWFSSILHAHILRLQGLQWGNKKGDVLFCLVFFIICSCNSGVEIIPKWQINDSWWSPIRLDDFWNFQNVHQIWPLTPRIYHQNASRNIRKYAFILKICFFISHHFGNPKFPRFWTLPDIKHLELILWIFEVVKFEILKFIHIAT